MQTNMKLLSRSDFGAELIRQVKENSRVLICINVAVLVVLLGVVLVCLQTGLPIANFTRDPAAITRSNPFFGFLSNIGVLFWCASAAICLFSATLLNARLAEDEGSLFLLSSGLLSLLLLLDDLFLLHEQVFPEYFSIDQETTIAGYGAITIAYLARFRRVILKTEYVFLALALGFFGLSQVADYLQDRVEIPWHRLFEEGFKLLGIVNWTGYFARTSRRQVCPSTGQTEGRRHDI